MTVIWLWLTLLLGQAQGQSSSPYWAELGDMMLIEAVEGDLERAISGYARIARHASDRDPVRTEALFRLGKAHWALGNVNEAREALLEGARPFGPWRPRCLELLGQIELETSAVSQVPTRWTFDTPEHGFVHPWAYRDKGSIRIVAEGPDEASALSWTTFVDRRDDQLEVGFHDPEPAPQGLRMRVHSADIDAYLRLTLYDTLGRRYVLPGSVFTLPSGEWTWVQADLAQLEPLDPLDPPLDPTTLERLVIQDVTAYHSRVGGANTLSFEVFEVY